MIEGGHSYWDVNGVRVLVRDGCMVRNEGLVRDRGMVNDGCMVRNRSVVRLESNTVIIPYTPIPKYSNVSYIMLQGKCYPLYKSMLARYGNGS